MVVFSTYRTRSCQGDTVFRKYVKYRKINGPSKLVYLGQLSSSMFISPPIFHYAIENIVPWFEQGSIIEDFILVPISLAPQFKHPLILKNTVEPGSFTRQLTISISINHFSHSVLHHLDIFILSMLLLFAHFLPDFLWDLTSELALLIAQLIRMLVVGDLMFS